MRHHTFPGKLSASCQVVYFRAQKRGACDYVNDNRWGRRSLDVFILVDYATFPAQEAHMANDKREMLPDVV